MPTALQIRDAASISKIALLHPKLRQEVTDIIIAIETLSLPANAKVRIVQGLRTIDEQNALYAQGRTKPGNIVTNAKGGSSYHNYGLAIDFVLMYDKDNNGSFEALSWDINYDFDKDGKKDWMEVVNEFKNNGWEWGGDWHSIIDNPHLQKVFGYNWRKLLEKYNNKDFIPGTKYVHI